VRRVWAYTACRVATLAGHLRASPARAIGQTAFAVAALVAIWHGASELARLLGELEIDRTVVVGGLVLVHAGVALGASSLVLGSTLLDARRSDEEEVLLVLPIRRLERFAFRGVDLAPALALSLVLVVPALRFAASAFGLGFAGEVALAGALACHALGAAFAALVGLVVWVRWAPRALVRWRGVGAIGAVGLVLAVGIASGATRADARAWGPPAWTVELVSALAVGDARLAARSAASTLAFVVVLGLVAEGVHARGVVAGWDRFRGRLEVGDARHARAVDVANVPVVTAPSDRRATSPPMRQAAALVALEWRAVVRDRALPVLVAGAAVIVGLVGSAIAMAGGEHAPTLWAGLWLGVGLVGANALALAALASMAREGYDLGALAWLPIDARLVVDTRAAAYAAVAGAWAAAWAGVWLGGGGADLARAPSGALVAIAVGFAGALAAIAAGLGAVCGRPGQGLHRGASLAGLGVFAMLEGLLFATAVASQVAIAHLGSAGAWALVLATAIWCAVLAVVRREAIAQVRSARRGGRYHG